MAESPLMVFLQEFSEIVLTLSVVCEFLFGAIVMHRLLR